jgi:hypothetical protein
VGITATKADLDLDENPIFDFHFYPGSSFPQGLQISFNFPINYDASLVIQTWHETYSKRNNE